MSETGDYIESAIKGAIQGVWDIYAKESKLNKKNNMHALSENLKRIAELLDNASVIIKNKEIPKDEAARLEVVISYAQKLATAFKKKHPKLAEVFESLLPNIAYEMQLADYVIKGKPTGNAVLSDDKKNIKLTLTPDGQIDKAYKELRKAVSTIDEHSRIFEQLSQ